MDSPYTSPSSPLLPVVATATRLAIALVFSGVMAVLATYLEHPFHRTAARLWLVRAVLAAVGLFGWAWTDESSTSQHLLSVGAGVLLALGLLLASQVIALAADRPVARPLHHWVAAALVGVILGVSGYHWSAKVTPAPMHGALAWVRLAQVVGHFALVWLAWRYQAMRPWLSARVQPLLLGSLVSAVGFLFDTILRLALLRADQPTTMELLSSVVSSLSIVAFGIGTLWSAFEIEREVMSNRSRDEQQARSAMAEVERLEALGRMSAGVAHDVNNMLTVVRTITSMVKNDQIPGRGQATEEAQRIIDEVDAARTWSLHLLRFAKSQAGATHVASITALTDGLSPVLRQAVPLETPIQFNFTDGPTEVRLDTALFELALVNLVRNAAESQRATAPIVVGVVRKDPLIPRQCQIGWLSVRPYVRVEVSDRGTGIPLPTMTRLFDPFFTTKGPERAGLGLYSVAQLAVATGGAVEVQPRQGGGTSVWLHLPICEPAAVEGQSALSDHRPHLWFMRLSRRRGHWATAPRRWTPASWIRL